MEYEIPFENIENGRLQHVLRSAFIQRKHNYYVYSYKGKQCMIK